MFAMKWYCLCSNHLDEQLVGEFERIVLQVWKVHTEKSVQCLVADPVVKEFCLRSGQLEIAHINLLARHSHNNVLWTLSTKLL